VLARLQFSRFKDKYKGQSAILFATGPSLEKFSWPVLPERPDILVGVNQAIFRDDLAFDHYWCSHFYYENADGSLDGPEAFLDKIVERSADMQVFCGTTVEGAPFYKHFSSKHASRMNAIEYDTLDDGGRAELFTADPSREPFHQMTIVFPPLQFLMYAGVKRIYLVGCDCGGETGAGGGVKTPPLWHGLTYNNVIKRPESLGDVKEWLHRIATEDWVEFAKFSKQHYPDVEFISVNPLNLVGLFTDIHASDNQ